MPQIKTHSADQPKPEAPPSTPRRVAESHARSEALLDELLAELRPINKAGCLVQSMASPSWRQTPAVYFQKNDLDLEIGKQHSASPTPVLAFRSLNGKSNSLSNAMRYEAAFERQFNRALRQLRSLIDTRKAAIEPTTTAASPWDHDCLNFDKDPEFTKK